MKISIPTDRRIPDEEYKALLKADAAEDEAKDKKGRHKPAGLKQRAAGRHFFCFWSDWIERIARLPASCGVVLLYLVNETDCEILREGGASRIGLVRHGRPVSLETIGKVLDLGRSQVYQALHDLQREDFIRTSSEVGKGRRIVLVDSPRLFSIEERKGKKKRTFTEAQAFIAVPAFKVIQRIYTHARLKEI